MSKAARTWLLAAILLGAAWLRVWRLAVVPAGLHYDIASNAILAGQIAFDGYRPVFIDAYSGREVLFLYSAALLFRLVGSSIFVLRLAGAFWGVAGIAAGYFAARQLARVAGYARASAVLASLFLAGCFMHVVFSRFGLRVITLPTVQALAIGWLGCALQRGHWRAWLLAGLFTGLTAHTYLAGRFLPVLVALALGVFVIALPRVQRRKVLGPLALFAFAAAAVFAPLGLHFWQQPALFWERAAQVGVRAGEGALLARNTLAAAGMVLLEGEPYSRYNIPGQPVLGALAGLLAVGGLAHTLLRVAHWHASPAGRARAAAVASEALLLAWVPVYLLPTALAVHEITPSNTRAFGVLPLLMVFPARGAWLLLQWLRQPDARGLPAWPAPRLRWLGAAALLFALVFAQAARDYFYVWQALPAQQLDNDGDLVAAARYLNANAAGAVNARVFMSALHFRHPTVAYLAQDYARIRWLTGARSLAIPGSGAAVFIFPQSAEPPTEWLAGWEGALRAAPLDALGHADFRVYQFADAAQVPLPAALPAAANFGNIAAITGYSVGNARAGEALRVDLHLQVQNPPLQPDYRVVADLLDARGNYWGQAFNDADPAVQWQPGDTLLTRLQWQLPASLPPGGYTLRTTIYSPLAQQQLPAINADGMSAAAAFIGPVLVARAALPQLLPQPAQTASAQAGGVRLLGIDLASTPLRPGEALPLTLYWQAVATQHAGLQLQLLLGAVELYSGGPLAGSYPSAAWQTGEVLMDKMLPRLPRTMTAGTHALRLRLVAGGQQVEAELGSVQVAEVAREFSAPRNALPLDATFGSGLRLAGYAFDAARGLTLHWQALAPVDVDYTVFVHVMNADGSAAAQHDGMPQAAAYPTRLWVAGEFVADPHPLQLPTGSYRAAVGLYAAETGTRLQLADGSDSVQFVFAVP